MREFALMRAGGSQRKMAVSRPFFRSFLQPFSIWLICSQSPPQFSPRRRLCAVMHSWRLCVCLSVCFNRFWKRAHRILMHRRSWVAFFRFSLFFFWVSHIEYWVSWVSTPSRVPEPLFMKEETTLFVWWSPLLRGLRFCWGLLTAEDYGSLEFILNSRLCRPQRARLCVCVASALITPQLLRSLFEKEKTVWELSSTLFGQSRLRTIKREERAALIHS